MNAKWRRECMEAVNYGLPWQVPGELTKQNLTEDGMLQCVVCHTVVYNLYDAEELARHRMIPHFTDGGWDWDSWWERWQQRRCEKNARLNGWRQIDGRWFCSLHGPEDLLPVVVKSEPEMSPAREPWGVTAWMTGRAGKEIMPGWREGEPPPPFGGW